MLTARLQKITAAFRISRKKHRKRTFSAKKIRTLRNLRLRVWQNALTTCLDGKSGKGSSQRLLLSNLASTLLIANQHGQIWL